MEKESKKLLSKGKIIAILVVVIVGGLLASYFLFFKDKMNTKYKAIFLDNNDIYFGKVDYKNDNYVKIKDVYSLRVSQVTKKDKDGKDVQEPYFQIIKMGSEIHGPKNEMEITREHILYIQELEKTSQVLSTIANYDKQTSYGNTAAETETTPQAETPAPATNTGYAPTTTTPAAKK